MNGDRRNRLRETREEQLKTLRRVAEDLGMDHSQIAKWERGEVEPSGISKVRLSRYYGVARSVLFPYEEEGAA